MGGSDIPDGRNLLALNLAAGRGFVLHVAKTPRPPSPLTCSLSFKALPLRYCSLPPPPLDIVVSDCTTVEYMIIHGNPGL